MRLVSIIITTAAIAVAGVLIVQAGPEHDTTGDGFVDLADALDVLAHFGEIIPTPTDTPTATLTPTASDTPTLTPTFTPVPGSGADLEVTWIRSAVGQVVRRPELYMIAVRNVGTAIGGAWVHVQLPPNSRRLGLQVGIYTEAQGGAGTGSQCFNEAGGVACWSGGLYPYSFNQSWFWMTVPVDFTSTADATVSVFLDGFDAGDSNPTNNTLSATHGVGPP